MIVVNEERCVGCGICGCFCPVDALEGLEITNWLYLVSNTVHRCSRLIFSINPRDRDS